LIENKVSLPTRRGVFRSIGLGLITGASDDDPSAIGTYASAGAKFGPALLWAGPVMLPMMITVVYLSSKLGQVSGKGLFGVMRDHYPRWVLHSALVGVLIGNVFEAGADIGGMAAALNVIIPVPIPLIAVATTAAILALQIFGSYSLIRNTFRWLSLSLLAYIASAFLAKPELLSVLRGTLLPHIQSNKEFLAMLVAIIGTSLSAYLYTWQSNVEVEEKVAMGRRGLSERQGATDAELSETKIDIISGMFAANLVTYFVMLAMWPLFAAGRTDINSAAQASEALKPVAGHAAGLLFTVGIVAVGFLAVPVMTTGAAYDLCQTFGWKHGLNMKAAEAKKFYWIIALFSVIAMCMNFVGFNPMKALVWAGIVQGFSSPALMLLIMLMTNNRSVMGEKVNTGGVNILGWLTTVALFAATIGLIVSWIL